MKRKHMAIALLATVFTACSNQEDILQEQDILKDVPMVVTTNLNEQVVSRAGITTVDDLKEHTFLFSSTPVGEEPGSSYIYTDLEVSYDSEENKWKFANIVPVWKDQTTNINVTALRAATPSNDVYSLVTTPNETTDIQANDWLYFSGMINPTLSGDANNELALKNGAIPINFKHINSKIDIDLSFKEGLPTLKIISVNIDGTKTSATLSGGVPSVEGGQTAPVEACSVVESTHYEVILLPQTATLEVEVNAKDENGQTYVFYWASSSEVTLESGKKYALELTLNYNEVNGLLASRGAWGSGGENQSLNAK